MDRDSPGIEDEETDSGERFYFVRKHGIPIPIFQAFLRVFAEKYRGKFRKDRGKIEKYRKPVDPDSDDMP